MTHSEGGIIGKHAALTSTRKQRSQVFRSLLDQRLDLNMAITIECVKILLEPRFGTFRRDSTDRYLIVTNAGDRSSRQKDPDRSGDAAAPEGWDGLPAAQQRFVDVMMEDVTKAAPVLPAEIARQLLGQRVANRIRMTNTFALDHLNLVVPTKTRYHDGNHQAGPSLLIFLPDFRK